MRIVMTDNSKLWNINDPFWEQFQEIILVVCLNGEAVTDKYECLVSPYTKKKSMRCGIGDSKLEALASVADKLNRELRYNDEIVFLTDNDPCSLYPFYVLKDLNENNSFHLITLSPWNFEGIRRSQAYHQMLSDLSALRSLLYYDSDRALKALGQPTNIRKAYSYVKKELEGMMVGVLNEIYENRYKGYCFFDFSSMSYVPLKEGFDKKEAYHHIQNDEIKFPLYRNLRTLGLVVAPSYPEKNEHIKKEIERPVARTDGKKICNMLREQRILLAEANNIPFESEECPTIGPCAGTCDKCDREAKYLYDQMKKIHEDERIYPRFEVIRSDSNTIPEKTTDEMELGEIELFQDILGSYDIRSADAEEYTMGDIFPAALFWEGDK